MIAQLLIDDDRTGGKVLSRIVRINQPVHAYRGGWSSAGIIIVTHSRRKLPCRTVANRIHIVHPTHWTDVKRRHVESVRGT